MNQADYEAAIADTKRALTLLRPETLAIMQAVGAIHFLADALGQVQPASRLTCPECGERWVAQSHDKHGDFVCQWMRCGCAKLQPRIVPAVSIQPRRKPLDNRRVAALRQQDLF